MFTWPLAIKNYYKNALIEGSMLKRNKNCVSDALHLQRNVYKFCNEFFSRYHASLVKKRSLDRESSLVVNVILASLLRSLEKSFSNSQEMRSVGILIEKSNNTEFFSCLRILTFVRWKRIKQYNPISVKEACSHWT